jgi:hypothetical protein
MHRPRVLGSPEREQIAREALAARLSAAALTQAAIREGSSKFRLFDGPKRLSEPLEHAAYFH